MEIDNILKDTTSSSIELCYKINSFLLEKLGQNTDSRELFEFIQLFRNSLNSFATVNNHLDIIQKFLLENNLEALIKFLNNFDSNEQKKILKIYKNLKIYDNKNSIRKILTLSNSKTIKELIKLIYEKNSDIQIFILRSLPGGEGEIAYQELKQKGINISLIEDYEAVKLFKEIEAVFIGADLVLNNGNVINKINSFALAIFSKYFQKPFLVLCDSSKFSTFNSINQLNFKDRENLFEEIPKNLITSIISDT